MGRTCDVNLDIQGVKLPEDIEKDLLRGFLKRPNSKKEEPVELKMAPDNSLGVSFVPQEPGEHQISVRKKTPDRNWRDLPGSPFSVVVVAPEAGNAIGRPCGVGLDILGLKLPDDYKFLRASLKRPSGKPEEPLPLALNSDNTLSVSFTPQKTGEHFVTVYNSGNHVRGSPFSVMVSSPGSADPSKVVCSGPGKDTFYFLVVS